MSTLAPTLQAFFTDRLIKQRQASPHTVAAYRDTFRYFWATPNNNSVGNPVIWKYPTSIQR